MVGFVTDVKVRVAGFVTDVKVRVTCFVTDRKVRVTGFVTNVKVRMAGFVTDMKVREPSFSHWDHCINSLPKVSSCIMFVIVFSSPQRVSTMHANWLILLEIRRTNAHMRASYC